MKTPALRWLLLLPSLAACALISKATPVDVRYFTPEIAHAPRADSPGEEPRRRLRLGRLTASSNLRYRIVHRESNVETGEYETLLWTDTPEAYVRRALVAAIVAAGLEQATGGVAPALDVEVVGFEEVHRDVYHGGRVELRYQLHDERSVLGSDVVVVERPAAGPAIEAVVVAIGAALDAATAQVATAVAARLRAIPRSP